MAKDLDEKMRVRGLKQTVGSSLEGSGGKAARVERLTPPEDELDSEQLMEGIDSSDLEDRPTGFAVKMPDSPPTGPNVGSVGGVPLREVSDDMLSEKARIARANFKARQSGIYRQELIECIREVLASNQENLDEHWREDDEFRSVIASLVQNKYDYPLEDIEEALSDLRVKF